jgi:hypothetical protein
MPHIMVGQGYSNADVAKEPALYAAQGNIVFSTIQAFPTQQGKTTAYQDLPSFMKGHGELSDLSGHLGDTDQRNLDVAVKEDLKEDALSDGTSSSISGKKPGWSGSTAQGTDQSTQSPAQSAGSHSGQDPQASQVRSSTAPSTDGSIQGTGPVQQNPRASSVGGTQVPQGTPATTDEKKNAAEMLHLAREAYDAEDYDLADQFLDEADMTDPELKSQITEARAEILQARTIRGK